MADGTHPSPSDACRDLRVVELGQGMAGSMPGMILADNGADVVKVEPPWGDWSRTQSGSHMWNRGKRSIALDLRKQEDRNLAGRLAERADVFIESFRPGVADRLGLGWSTLHNRNRRLVYCSISGFGPAGAYAELPGYEGIVAAVSGHMVGLDVLSGAVPGQYRDAPIYTAVPVASFAAAQLATQGVLAALLAREETGEGDHVTTSLVQGLAAILMRQEMARAGDPTASTAKRATPAMNAGIELCFMTAPLPGRPVHPDVRPPGPPLSVLAAGPRPRGPARRSSIRRSTHGRRKAAGCGRSRVRDPGPHEDPSERRVDADICRARRGRRPVPDS